MTGGRIEPPVGPHGPGGRAVDPKVQERLLTEGDVAILGRVVDSSNATYLVEVADGDDRTWAIYKPQSGERPLWDFDPGLYRRERAAYLLDAWLGWDIVPPTVIRSEAPLGVGSLQWFIEFDPEQHYFTLFRTRPETHDWLRRMAVFDVVANNTDRKGGHVLADADGRLWGIDHGLCFGADFKLRTVIWDFAGDDVARTLLDALAPLVEQVPSEVAELLDAREVRALQRRTRRLLTGGVLPVDTTGRAWPWPLV